METQLTNDQFLILLGKKEVQLEALQIKLIELSAVVNKIKKEKSIETKETK